MLLKYEYNIFKTWGKHQQDVLQCYYDVMEMFINVMEMLVHNIV